MIYVKDRPSLIKSRKSLSEFIEHFIRTSPGTFDKDGELQCFPRKKRSFGDTVALCKTYFKCTKVDVAKVLLELCSQGIARISYCPTIRKRVIFINNNANYSVRHSRYVTGLLRMCGYKYNIEHYHSCVMICYQSDNGKRIIISNY